MGGWLAAVGRPSAPGCPLLWLPPSLLLSVCLGVRAGWWQLLHKGEGWHKQWQCKASCKVVGGGGGGLGPHGAAGVPGGLLGWLAGWLAGCKGRRLAGKLG